MRLIDIGVNLTDSVFACTGTTATAQSNLNVLLSRAKNLSGIQKIIITGTSHDESLKALQLAQQNEMLYCTLGCHPTSCVQEKVSADPDAYFDRLMQIYHHEQKQEQQQQQEQQNDTRTRKIVAIGECGLDWARLQWADKESQMDCFLRHFELAKQTGLPMFIHDRDTQGTVIDLLAKHHGSHFHRAVVHSFTGTKRDVQDIVTRLPGVYISVNGCSLRSEEGCAVVKDIPLDRLMVETDAPWCAIRKTSAAHKLLSEQSQKKNDQRIWEASAKSLSPVFARGMIEPCALVQVVEAVAALKGISAEAVAEATWQNTIDCFGFTDR